MKIAVSNYQVLPADVYPATLKGILEKDSDYGPAVLLEFVISDGEYAGQEVSGMASATLSRKAKLRGWVEGMMGKALPADMTELDMDKLIGRSCRLNVSVKTVKDNMEVNRIETILPVKPPKTEKPAPAPSNGDPF